MHKYTRKWPRQAPAARAPAAGSSLGRRVSRDALQVRLVLVVGLLQRRRRELGGARGGLRAANGSVQDSEDCALGAAGCLRTCVMRCSIRWFSSVMRSCSSFWCVACMDGPACLGASPRESGLSRPSPVSMDAPPEAILVRLFSNRAFPWSISACRAARRSQRPHSGFRPRVARTRARAHARTQARGGSRSRRCVSHAARRSSSLPRSLAPSAHPHLRSPSCCCCRRCARTAAAACCLPPTSWCAGARRGAHPRSPDAGRNG